VPRVFSAVLAERQGAPLEVLHARHDEYVAMTRSIAKSENCELIEAAGIFASDPRGDALFLRDGIHMKAGGRELMADLIYAKIKALDH
jgi:lysophospholipase L1-like esterase